jgi:hypothetical protein
MPSETVNLEKLIDLSGNHTAIRRLINQLNEPDGVVPVLGWGLSYAVGLKSWSRFLNEQGALADFSAPEMAGLESDLWDATEDVLSHSNSLLFLDAIESEYGWHRVRRIKDHGAAGLLPHLTRDVIITTAIDNLLEVAFEQEGFTFGRVLSADAVLSSNLFDLFGLALMKVSGDANNPETLVLTRSQRNAIWGAPPSFTGLHRAISDATDRRSLFFVGYDLAAKDNPLRQILQLLPKGGLKIHYAIIPEWLPSRQFKRELADLSIRPIYLPGGDYRFIKPLLEYLTEQIDPMFRRRLPTAEVAPAATEHITVMPETPSVPFVEVADIPALKVPDALTMASASGECVLFVGSGLSARAGLPTWLRFVDGLLDWSVKHQVIDPQNAKVQRQALREGEANAVADNLANLYKEDQKLLLLEYCRSAAISQGALPSAYLTLRNIPFGALLTTNFDDLLLRTYDGAGLNEILTPVDSEKLHEALAKNRLFLLKLYGTLDRPETAIIAPAEYDAMLRSNVLFLNFMEALFFSRTIFFVGASLEGIADYLRGFRFSGPVTKQHYALVAVSGSAWRAKADVLARRYNITVLPFRLSGDFPEVDEFLEKLAAAVGSRRNSAGYPQAATPGKLVKVQLRNIGPFESLDIDLKANWMILLGDNGVGKSSILKAIGVAIAGSEAKDYASRIVRAGQSSASVTLITDRNPSGYVTEILKRDVDAEVISRPSRPLEPENWVALGFPPLRTVSWNPSQGPLAGGKGRPSPEDVLPLIRGEADPRLDRLKQWIVNLDSEDNKQQAAGNKANTAARILTDFFEAVGQITEGFRVTRGEVTSDYRVFVNTPDGPLPIAALSQGLTSLYSWVGILLQRLYEVRDPDDATKSHALILMDEIDAHMHPAWQQILVHQLKRIFPNLQVIASTHSPLIVAGMSVEEITRLERDANGKIAIRPIESDMTMGRADQVLTSGLFGLPTTMDPVTRKKLDDYHRLLVIPEVERNEQQENEFQKLRQELGVRIPVSMESPADRRAMELVKLLLKQNVGDSYPEIQELLLNKAEQLFDEVRNRKERRL